MLLGFLIIVPLCGVTVTFALSTISAPSLNTIPTITTTTMETLPPLQLEASPDYPVAAGQQVHLTCSAPSISVPVTWYFNYLQNNSWTKVGSGKEMTLTMPANSGLYQCVAESTFQKSVSPNHTVFIVSFQATAVEPLGEPALVLSILNLIIIVAALLWFIYRRFSDQSNASNTPMKEAVPRPQVKPKVCSPSCDVDGDVYMNYTGSNPSYTDLDPAKMTADNLYSTLS